MPATMGLPMALILIVGAMGLTSAQHSLSISRDSVIRSSNPLPVVPLPPALSNLLPLHNKLRPPSSRPFPVTTNPVPAFASQSKRPLPTVPKVPPLPPRLAVGSTGALKPPPPPPPVPSLPAATRPTPPPPSRPRPSPTTTRRPSTTTTVHTTERPVALPTAVAGGAQEGGVKDSLFDVFKMSDDGSYLYEFTAESVGLRQREEGFLKMVGGDKIPVKRGFYTYTAADGKPVSISYEADELGFRVTGEYQAVTRTDPYDA